MMPRTRLNNKTVEKIVSIVFIFIIILFFVIYLRDINFSVIRNAYIDWAWLFPASVFAIGFTYWGSVVWRNILVDLETNNLPGFATLSNIYAKAWLARYIPGSIAHIAGKVYMASKYGVSKSKLTTSTLVENGMQILSITVVSILLLVFEPRLNTLPLIAKIILVVIGLLLVLLLHPRIFNTLIGKAYKVFKKQEPSKELQINNKTIVRSFLLYTIGAFIIGTAYFLLTLAIYPEISLREYFFIVGTVNIAGAIGMATPLIPSGLGVKDGVQLILLSAIMPKEIALIITIVSRLWLAITDVLFYLITEIILFNKNRLKPRL